MQQTGTLRKRRRRNLSKVIGLNNLPYDGNEDELNTVRIQECSNFNFGNDSTVLNITSSQFAELRKKSGGIPSSRTRPTRNPIPNRNTDKVYQIENGESQSEYQSSKATEELEWEENQIPKINQSINDRPYLFDSFTMSILKLVLLVGQTSGAIPWKWDKETPRLTKCSAKLVKNWKTFRAIFHLQTACLTVFQFYVFWYFASSGKYTNREIFMSSFSLTAYIYWVDHSINMYFHEDQMREYVNTLLKFNSDMVSKHVIDLHGYHYDWRLLINLATVGTLGNLPLVIITFLQMPFEPWYLFSYIYPKPWYWKIPGSIQTYLLFGQMLFAHSIGIWVVVAHATTVQFWLSETHNNNGSEYTSNDIRKQKTGFEIYKSLQVLNSCFNDCMSPMFLPILKVHVASVVVICGYIVIRSMSTLFEQDFYQFVTFPVAILVTSFQAFVSLTMSAKMSDLGTSFLDSWSQTDDKDFKKSLLSCASLKVQVRKFYFCTVSTTVTYFRVVFGMITDTIISLA